METFLAFLLTSILLYQLIKNIRNKDNISLFSPITFFVIYFLYYVVYPFFTSETDIYGSAENHGSGDYTRMLIGAIVNFCGILFGFNYLKKEFTLRGVNAVYDFRQAKPMAVILFLIGFFAYYFFNDFSLDLIREQEEFFDATEHRLYHSSRYFSALVSLFPVCSCLLYATKSSKIYIILLSLLVLSMSVLSGSRVTLILFFIPFFVFVHLYPEPKKPRYWLLLPIAIVVFVFMGIVEKTRNYGSGLDIDRLRDINSLTYESTKANEAEYVYYFSSRTMNVYAEEEPLFFEIIGTALFFPIPRSLFPEKPDAQYLRDGNLRVLGSDKYGAAYLNYVEGYLAFGWLGVLFNGICLGWLSRIFWSNYRKNRKSIGAIIFLGMFEGVSYVLISRGYLAQEFFVFMYYIPIVYFVSKYMGVLIDITKRLLTKKH